jgi:acetyl-CoA carboxylase biotin carboxylase subunit
MHRALLELTIEGVETSRDFHLRVFEDAEFRDGAIEIQWLERRLADLTNRPPPPEGVMRAAIAAVLLVERERSVPRAPAPSAAGATTPDFSDRTNWVRAARLEGLR